MPAGGESPSRFLDEEASARPSCTAMQLAVQLAATSCLGAFNILLGFSELLKNLYVQGFI